MKGRYGSTNYCAIILTQFEAIRFSVDENKYCRVKGGLYSIGILFAGEYAYIATADPLAL